MLLFKKGAAKIAAIDALETLKQSLESLGDIPSYSDKKVFDYAVDFFNIITSFQDTVVIDDKSFKATPAEIKSIKQHISNAGRNPYGWVRAEKGKPVTLDNLYLGNVFGIWTLTARQLKDSEVEFGDKSILKNSNSKIKDRELIANEQLIPFLKSHRQDLINLSGKVLSKNKKPMALVNLSGRPVNMGRGSR